MNILFTTHQGGIAGATYSTFYLAQGLAKKGHQIHIACNQDSLLWRLTINYGNISLHDIGEVSYFDLPFIVKVKRIIKSYQIDLLNAQGGKDRNLVILAKWLFGLDVRLVFTRRQRPRDEPWIKRWFHQKGTDKIVCVSEGLQELFLRKGYNPDHLEVIYNGIPKNLIKQEYSKNLSMESKIDRPIIGCVARKKYQEVLLQAFAYLPDHYQLLFVGIDQSEFSLPTSNDRIVFTGLLPHEEVIRKYASMDVMVLPSKMDGFGLVLLEAMQAGVPVIGSDFGGIKDVIEHGHNGLLFDNENPKMLADQIQYLTEDQQLRGQLIRNGYDTVNNRFTLENTVDGFEKLFRDLIT